ncbi:MAG: hypothetical protein ABI700_16465 [Chloroflexota bacterium]
MRPDPQETPEVFIVNPVYYRYVMDMDGIDFSSLARDYLRKAALWLLPTAFALILWILGVVTRNISFLSIAGLASLAALWTIGYGLAMLKTARIQRRLAQGQFIEGKIASSRAYWDDKGKKGTFTLEIDYTFDTPTDDQISHVIQIQRPDLWLRAPKHLIHAVVDQGENADLHELAPEPGTPLKIRYVDDSFFRLM